MKIIFNTSYSNQKQTLPTISFKRNVSDITANQIIQLIKSGKTVKQISAELGIALDTYYKLLKHYNISYNKQKLSDKLSNISRENFSALLQQGLLVSEICEKLKITPNAYYKLLEHFDLKSPIKILKDKNKSITAQQLEEKIKSGLSVKQIVQSLEITENIYFSLLKKFKIQTPYKKAKMYYDSISQEQFVDLLASGKSYQEILNELQITPNIYSSLLAKFGIKTKQNFQKEKIASITKEQIETLIKDNKSAKEISQILNIPERTYSRLLAKFGIVTENMINRNHIASIDARTLQKLVDEKLSPDEICKRLDINNSIFYKLLKRLKINYNYQHHFGEIVIPKDRLEQLASSGKTIKQIAEELKCAETTYSEKAKVAQIKTVYRESINTLDSVSIKKLQEMIDAKMPVQQICKNLNITHANYTALIRKYNLQTAHRKSRQTISNIKKQDIIELRKAGKSIEEICKELNISQSTYRRILNKKENV